MILSIVKHKKKYMKQKCKNVSVFAVPKYEYFYVYGQKNLVMEEYKNGLTKLLEVVGTKYIFKKLVMSLGNLDSTPILGRAWFATYFAPTFYQKAGKDVTVAIVKPKNRFEAVTVDIILNSLSKLGVNIEFQLFEDEQNAINWIENPIFE